MSLWRLGSPTVCCLQSEDPGKLMVSESEGLRTRSTDGVTPSLRAGED